jgi:hypothetical protein
VEWDPAICVLQTVRGTIESFETEDYYDYLHVWDGEVLIASLSGSYRPGSSFTSTNNVVHLQFQSDSSIRYQGFYIRYEAGESNSIT